jgi:hypothetical protein
VARRIREIPDRGGARQRPRLMGSIDVPWAARHPSIAAAAGERPMNPLLTRPLTADQRVSVAASLIYTITFCNL